ncbi:bck1-like resistance to osmotic shock, partial [Dipsacomyces acuminosporus]
MPRPPCIAIQFKQTAEADWVRPLRSYIQRVYEEDPQRYDADCQRLQRMRQDMRGANADSVGKDIIFSYYSHLETLEPRLKVNEQGAKVAFKWTSGKLDAAFVATVLSDTFTGKSTQQYSLAFEKASVLFNLATAFGMCAANWFASPSAESEGDTLRMAGIYFQIAAERFNYINENFLHAPSADLHQDSVNVLSNIMLAQAQECAIELSHLDKKKEATLSKLAQQAASMYSSVVDTMKGADEADKLPHGWLALAETKHRYYQALAQYHEARSDESKGHHGQAIARYNLAEKHAHETIKLLGQFADTFFSTTNIAEDLTPESVQGLQEMTTKLAASIAEEMSRVNHDNDVVYNEAVPNVSTLSPIGSANVVKNYDINKFYSEDEKRRIIGESLFGQLMSMAVHESSSLYSEEKDKLIRSEASKVASADEELNVMLSFLQMPQCLKKFKRALASTDSNSPRHGPAALPPEFTELSQAVREAITDVRTAEMQTPLSELTANVDAQRMRAKEEIRELTRLLDDEQRESNLLLTEHAADPYYTQFQPSASAASFYRSELAERKKNLETAVETDNKMHKDYLAVLAPWMPALKSGLEGIISVLLEQLNTLKLGDAISGKAAAGENLLDVGQGEPVGLSGHVKAVEETYDKLVSLRKMRHETLESLKSVVREDDISGSLLKANSGKDLQQVFAIELQKFSSYVERIQTSIITQSQLSKRLQAEFRSLMESPQGSSIQEKWDLGEQKKATVENQVMEAAQFYGAVVDGLSKASTFYVAWIKNTLSFRAQVQTFVDTRAQQREQLHKQAVKDAAARDQAAIKEKLSQYSAPPHPPPMQHAPLQPPPPAPLSQQPPHNAYQQPVQPGYAAQPPQALGGRTFDVNQLVDQTAQLSLSSPQGGPSAPPLQPSAPQYQSAGAPPPPPPPAIQREQPREQQQQQQHAYLAPPPQQQPPQQQQLYGSPVHSYQQPATSSQPAYSQISTPSLYSSIPASALDVPVDPYSATVRRSMALDTKNLVNPIDPSYKPGYGSYTSAPIQQAHAASTSAAVAAIPAIPGYSAVSNVYAVSAQAPVVSAGYAQPAQSIHQQQPVYGGRYSEPQNTSVPLPPHQTAVTQPQANGYAPPPYPPPPQ